MLPVGSANKTKKGGGRKQISDVKAAALSTTATYPEGMLDKRPLKLSYSRERTTIKTTTARRSTPK
jgi:hypothetical protein